MDMYEHSKCDSERKSVPLDIHSVPGQADSSNTGTCCIPTANEAAWLSKGKQGTLGSSHLRSREFPGDATPVPCSCAVTCNVTKRAVGEGHFPGHESPRQQWNAILGSIPGVLK